MKPEPKDQWATSTDCFRRAYRLVLAGEVVVTSWLELVETRNKKGARTGWEIRTWNRTQDSDGKPGKRAKSVHVMSLDGHLKSYKFEEARRSIFIAYRKGAYVFSDGKYVISEVPSAPAECFLEDNNFASLAGLFAIRSFLGQTSDVIQALPEGSYEVTPMDVEHVSATELNFCGITFALDAHGLLISGKMPGQPIAVEAEEADIPPELMEDLYQGGADFVGLYPVANDEFCIKTDFGDVFGTLAASALQKIPDRVGVMIGGTGRFNRDGKTLSGLNIGYGRFMDGLASLGLTNIRYDRRPSLGAREVLTQLDFTKQANAVVESIFDVHQAQAVVIGHSYGGLVASEVARGKDGVALLVLISAPARTIMGSIQWQRKQAMATMTDPSLREKYREAAETFDAKLRDADLEDLTHTERSSIAFFRSVGDRTIFDSLGDVNCPILILHGAEDEQVPEADARKIEAWLRERGKTVTCQIVPDVGHMLNPVGEDAPDEATLRAFDKLLATPIIEAVRACDASH